MNFILESLALVDDVRNYIRLFVDYREIDYKKASNIFLVEKKHLAESRNEATSTYNYEYSNNLYNISPLRDSNLMTQFMNSNNQKSGLYLVQERKNQGKESNIVISSISANAKFKRDSNKTASATEKQLAIQTSIAETPKQNQYNIDYTARDSLRRLEIKAIQENKGNKSLNGSRKSTPTKSDWNRYRPNLGNSLNILSIEVKNTHLRATTFNKFKADTPSTVNSIRSNRPEANQAREKRSVPIHRGHSADSFRSNWNFPSYVSKNSNVSYSTQRKLLVKGSLSKSLNSSKLQESKTSLNSKESNKTDSAKLAKNYKIRNIDFNRIKETYGKIKGLKIHKVRQSIGDSQNSKITNISSKGKQNSFEGGKSILI